MANYRTGTQCIGFSVGTDGYLRKTNLMLMSNQIINGTAELKKLKDFAGNIGSDWFVQVMGSTYVRLSCLTLADSAQRGHIGGGTPILPTGGGLSQPGTLAFPTKTRLSQTNLNANQAPNNPNRRGFTFRDTGTPATKYIFVKDYQGVTYVGPTEKRASFVVNFKKGDIVEGFETMLDSKGMIGAAGSYVTLSSPKGEVRIYNNPSLGPNNPALAIKPNGTSHAPGKSEAAISNNIKWQYVVAAIAGAAIFYSSAKQFRPTAKLSSLVVVAVLGALIGLGTATAGDYIMKKISA